MPISKIKTLMDLDEVPSSKRSWKIYIDGKEIPVKERLSIVSKDYGQIDYGLSPLGYDAISYRFSYKGGVVFVPYTRIKGELYVAFIKQSRPYQNGDSPKNYVLNLPRGYTNKGEDFLESVKRETMEELGLDVTTGVVQFKKLSDALNPDNGLYDTADFPNSGVAFYSIYIPSQYLEKIGEKYAIGNQIRRTDTKKSQSDEHISSCHFYRWTKVFELKDAFSLLGVLLLKHHLSEQDAYAVL